jgi:hypothetical protein
MQTVFKTAGTHSIASYGDEPCRPHDTRAKGIGEIDGNFESGRGDP